jgi:hypothetical protein
VVNWLLCYLRPETNFIDSDKTWDIPLGIYRLSRWCQRSMKIPKKKAARKMPRRPAWPGVQYGWLPRWFRIDSFIGG